MPLVISCALILNPSVYKLFTLLTSNLAARFNSSQEFLHLPFCTLLAHSSDPSQQSKKKLWK